MRRRRRNTIENKTTRIEVRFAESEKQELLKRCESLEYTLSNYIRDAALGKKIISKTDIKTAFQLRKIGVNLNQIAKQLNTFPVDDDTRRVISSIEQHLITINEVADILLFK